MLYTLLRGIVKIFFHFLGLKIDGLHKLPKEGRVIVASNHVSNWDPIIIAVALDRPIHFMAKKELFSNPIFSLFFRSLNAFPVKRGTADRKAIRHALAVLKDSKVLGIFPEGVRVKSGMKKKAQSGVAMIAIKSKTPIVPIACIGTNAKIPFGWIKPLVVKVGRPIYLTEYYESKLNSAVLEEISEDILQEIDKLLSK
ncbi:Acyl-CoA:1-acyl-sn-glycerol-3-phosphate acyltransferase [Candidatus Syntrophocurvum alkaliphilum]|uniref:Acyl-CoA:1-acyl-sn-glycerol-3-phosphate acyltransferase n=1 Tax=Candidatus Syntrophocurvum alkaliphilum TaxID=2293317 RepID=A0A6I6DFA8_9FIRM|nr:lysophospholipid acyltransferase family protein [Candidatus Syntrophocurvum alkaliphilum]QGT99846.1 Acyl-CoA:1-acyl-sn-glycerol-3-phosphate acyltransferase [Candidatus Syntrophocurvum alkaliphilum]